MIPNNLQTRRQYKQDTQAAQTTHEQRLRELEQQLTKYTEWSTRLQCECDRLMQLSKQHESEKEKQIVESNKFVFLLAFAFYNFQTLFSLQPAFWIVFLDFLEIKSLMIWILSLLFSIHLHLSYYL